MKEPTIRLYNNDDKKPLLELLQLNIPKYFHSSELKDFEDYLDNYREDYYVFEKNGSVLGSAGINYSPDKDHAWLSWDLIHPDHQGKGIGKQLTQYRIMEIRKNPSLKSLKVRTSQLAYKFYEKMGFRLEKTEKDFWAKGFNLYQMDYELI